MFKQVKKLNFPAGFTLLEIMLVLLLIGMASVGVMMTMPQNANKNENIDWQAQRFSTLLQFAEDEALISGKELALVFKDNTYRFTVYNYQSKKWLAMVDKPIAELIEIPDSISLKYTLLGSVWDEIEVEDKNAFFDDDYLVKIEGEDKQPSFLPQVYIMSSGEVTPFSLSFTKDSNGNNERSRLVTVDMSGVIKITEPGEQ